MGAVRVLLLLLTLVPLQAQSILYMSDVHAHCNGMWTTGQASSSWCSEYKTMWENSIRKKGFDWVVTGGDQTNYGTRSELYKAVWVTSNTSITTPGSVTVSIDNGLKNGNMYLLGSDNVSGGPYLMNTNTPLAVDEENPDKFEVVMCSARTSSTVTCTFAKTHTAPYTMRTSWYPWIQDKWYAGKIVATPGNHDNYSDGTTNYCTSSTIIPCANGGGDNDTVVAMSEFWPENIPDSTKPYYIKKVSDNLSVYVFNYKWDATSSGTQATWFSSQLATCPTRWCIGTIHELPYGCDYSRGTDWSAGDAIDVMFGGHTHNYQRVQHLNKSGSRTINYITNGMSGSEALPGACTVATNITRFNDQRSYSIIRADFNTLTVETYDATDTLRDSFSLTKDHSTTVGGLVSLANPVSSPSYLTNGSFEDGETGWTITGTRATVSTDAARTGTHSLKYDSSLSSASNISQAPALPGGRYRIRGWWKASSGFGACDGTGADKNGSWIRLGVTTPTAQGYMTLGEYHLCGTVADWTEFSSDYFMVPEGLFSAYPVLQGYGSPSGIAYIDDLVLERQAFPLSVFMKYPNFRGYLFSDQSQTLSFDVTTDCAFAGPCYAPLYEATAGSYKTKYVVTDETDASTVASSTHTAVPTEVVSIDATGWNSAHTYLVTFSLLDASDNEVYVHTPYRVIPKAASYKTSWPLTFSEDGRFVVKGTPKFLIGVYDSELSSASTAQSYLDHFEAWRWLSDIPGLNWYFNYHNGDMVNTYGLPYQDAVNSSGWLGPQTMNCNQRATYRSAFWTNTATNGDITDRAAKPMFGGWYLADECPAYRVPEMEAWRAKLQDLGPGTLTWGALLSGANGISVSGLPAWRDTLDLIATDPYPVQTGSTTLSDVGVWTTQALAAQKNSRPTMTFIQYFGDTGAFVWPTKAQLRNMTYAAITAGANGVGFWETGQGAGALYGSCTGGTQDLARYTVVGKTGQAYSSALYYPNSSGTWVINSGALPDGLTLTDAAAGTISGTPTVAGDFYINATRGGTYTSYYKFTIVSAWGGKYVNDGYTKSWCATRIARWGYLTPLIAELYAIHNALDGVDVTGKLSGNTQTDVHTRVKTASGKYYLLATNTTASTLNPTFTWATSVASVAVDTNADGAGTITPSGATFTDSFGAYEAHVYEITEGDAPTSVRINGATVNGTLIK